MRKSYFLLCLFMTFVAAIAQKGWAFSPHDEFLIHGTPKTGTHFIRKVIFLMTGEQVRLGSPNPAFIHQIDQLKKNNAIIMITPPFESYIERFILENNYKVIAYTRDSRDALLSNVFYMRNYPTKTKLRDYFHVGENFDDLSLEQQITSMIRGDEHSESYILIFKERVGWALNKNHLMIKYEELINETHRKEAVLKIADFIHLDLSKEKLDQTLQKMYQDYGENSAESKTYKRSSSGNWRKFLNEEQKLLIKQLIGWEIKELGYEENDDW